ncbi:CatB-related O-acetyltransferase, partial [Desulfosarcina sp.]|uniref:CatB-related O-acetyltransferase n=1 Tax=Desulfosarcina sp. TaxID=2027861 RepID=UPI0039B9A1D5
MRETHQAKDVSLRETNELRESPVISFLGRLVNWPGGRRFQLLVLRRAIRHEGGMYCSSYLREFLRDQRQVDLGTYSYGRLSDLLAFPIKTCIGRYTSIGPGVKIFQANHPMDWPSMHPYFYRKDLGYVENEGIVRGALDIGHDVWLGANTIITPGCSKIGHGAVVAAGAIVTRDVPPYAVVAGNPAAIKKYRFSENEIEQLLAQAWWELSIAEIAEQTAAFTTPVSADVLHKIQLLKNE